MKKPNGPRGDQELEAMLQATPEQLIQYGLYAAPELLYSFWLHRVVPLVVREAKRNGNMELLRVCYEFMTELGVRPRRVRRWRHKSR